ncbi:MAG: hypothetical protein RJB38_851 [Pseudomonadota bacterium]|jgi:glycerol uptake facilitator-like aquaporin
MTREKARYGAEFLGTTFLLMIIVGSGIMANRLAQGNTALALLANSLATGSGLFVLIHALGPISGAHFNPAVSLLETLSGRLDQKNLLLYWLAQFTGALFGVFMTHLMFDMNLLQLATTERSGVGLTVSEFVATFGLLATVELTSRKRVELTPAAVATYITSAYWFTPSTSFANPAVTIARIFTDTFCGIAPAGVPWFLIAQIIGTLTARALLPKRCETL